MLTNISRTSQQSIPHVTLLALCFLISASAVAQDFANLNRYAKANKKLDGAIHQTKTVIIGDSITERWVRNRPHFFGQTGIVGRGVVSETTPQMLLRFRQDVLELGPSTVVILGGTNDIAGNSGKIPMEVTLGYLKSMVELAQHNNIVPVLCSVPPADRFFWNIDVEPGATILELNRRIKAYADSKGIRYVDFHSSLKTLNNGMRLAFSDDGVHPNALGYSVMELQLERALR